MRPLTWAHAPDDAPGARHLAELGDDGEPARRVTLRGFNLSGSAGRRPTCLTRLVPSEEDGVALSRMV
jgi:hypothetical protein